MAGVREPAMPLPISPSSMVPGAAGAKTSRSAKGGMMGFLSIVLVLDG